MNSIFQKIELVMKVRPFPRPELLFYDQFPDVNRSTCRETRDDCYANFACSRLRCAVASFTKRGSLSKKVKGLTLHPAEIFMKAPISITEETASFAYPIGRRRFSLCRHVTYLPSSLQRGKHSQAGKIQIVHRADSQSTLTQ